MGMETGSPAGNVLPAMKRLLPLVLALAACLPAEDSAQVRAREELKGLSSELSRWSRAFSLVHEAVAPSVVAIHTRERQYQRLRSPFGGVILREQGEEEVGEGSGFVVRSDDKHSYILTNAHVVLKTNQHQQFETDRNGRELGYDRLTVELNDSREVDAEYVGWSVQTDLAVIRVPLPNLPAVEWGNSDQAHVGDWVVALGYPLGVGYSASSGIISATDRSTGIYRPMGGLESFLQTDAAINPGNSGGPLVDLQGRILGVNANIISRTGANIGLGFAIAANLARRVADDLIDHGAVRWPGIGIEFDSIDAVQAAEVGLPRSPALRVSGVLAGSPADKAGIKNGDILLSLNGLKTMNDMQFRARLSSSQIGQSIPVQLWREKERVTTTVTPIALEEIHRMRAVEVASRGVSLGDFGLTVASDGQSGLAIVGVDPQGLAAQAGLKVGDRVLQEHRQGPLATTQDAKALAGKRELVLQVAQNSRLLWIRMRR